MKSGWLDYILWQEPRSIQNVHNVGWCLLELILAEFCNHIFQIACRSVGCSHGCSWDISQTWKIKCVWFDLQFSQIHLQRIQIEYQVVWCLLEPITTHLLFYCCSSTRTLRVELRYILQTLKIKCCWFELPFSKSHLQRIQTEYQVVWCFSRTDSSRILQWHISNCVSFGGDGDEIFHKLWKSNVLHWTSRSPKAISDEFK